MQSAARVPILISFEVEDYSGPDKDQILQSSNLINHLVEVTPLELAKSLKTGTFDSSPQRKLLSPIIEKSGVKMPQIYLEWTQNALKEKKQAFVFENLTPVTPCKSPDYLDSNRYNRNKPLPSPAKFKVTIDTFETQQNNKTPEQGPNVEDVTSRVNSENAS